MAAEVLATAGHEVAVFDQHRSPARKFVLAGRGGLNITHSEPTNDLLDRYGAERAQLEPAIRAFTADDLRAWSAGLGHETFTGTSGRVFPSEFRAVPLLRSWIQRLDQLSVDFRMQHRWLGWNDERELLFESVKGQVAESYDVAILGLGGASWPRVGGDGSWQTLLREVGVEVDDLVSANCGVQIQWSDIMVDKFAGAPLKNSAVIVDGVEVRGDPIVTKTGLEGGPIYAHSRRIRKRLAAGEKPIAVDLFPDLDFDALEDRLSRMKPSETMTKRLARSGMSPVAISLLREATGNDIPLDGALIAKLAKAVPLNVDSMAGIDRAISSAGGVRWSEMDEHFQLSALPNVYAVGEMLNWEAPTGGYLLQACFSTAHWTASGIVNAAAKVD